MTRQNRKRNRRDEDSPNQSRKMRKIENVLRKLNEWSNQELVAFLERENVNIDVINEFKDR
eukprot:UN13685